ncbi:MAG: enoyl-CoA hydratase/isomerase family protein [Deltaproteobacteria bacterium]|nr:enoyl-CoA hydratase/isomerase family protein [Deltaproteobacteria bacterium]
MATILVTGLEQGVFQVTVCRPEARNAFDGPLIEEWCARLAELAARSPRAVVVTGAGDTFCAGYDVREIAPDQDPDQPHPDSRFERVVLAAAELPCPTVAAVNGDAFGGGTDLALSCDLCVAAPTARFAMTPCRLGLVYSAGGAARFVARLGAPLARKLFLTAMPLAAAELERSGALEVAASRDAVLPRALELAGRIASNAPLAVRGTRAAIAAVEAALATALPDETRARLRALRNEALRSDDLREGLAAFHGKRPPKFEGR